MDTRHSIERGVDHYSGWRSRLRSDIDALGTWLDEAALDSREATERLQQLLALLSRDRLYVAVLAEFSRGKSELINAVFFGSVGQRVLPSTAGRTTMCPTELFHDPSAPPSLRLLPVETRTAPGTLAESLQEPAAWHTIALDPADPDGLARTLNHLTEVSRVEVDRARAMGFMVDETANGDNGIVADADGVVEIPRWRHALVNFPHPLLQQGVVVLDTPGLNALGSEPDLTLNLLGNAHAAVYVLAADTGVTRSDLAVWKEHVVGEPTQGCEPLVVLNKVDVLWDDLRSAEETAAEVERQCVETARMLDIPRERVFPLSARQGLLARVRGDEALLHRSGLPAFEQALAALLIPTKQKLIRNSVGSGIEHIREAAGAVLEQRLRDAVAHLGELDALNVHNTEVVRDLMDKVDRDREMLERDVQRFQATRSVFARHAKNLSGAVSQRRLEALIAQTRKDMSTSLTSAGLRASAADFFASVRERLDAAAEAANEAHALMASACRQFHGDAPGEPRAPNPMSMRRYHQQLLRLEQTHLRFLRGPSLVVTEQMVVTRRFFASVAGAVRTLFAQVRDDGDSWLLGMIDPLETRVREHQIQLRRRLESIKRIHKARDTLGERLQELRSQRDALLDIQEQFSVRMTALESLLEATDHGPIGAERRSA